LKDKVLFEGAVPVVVPSCVCRLAPSIRQCAHGGRRGHRVAVYPSNWGWESNVEGISRRGRIGCCPSHRIGVSARVGEPPLCRTGRALDILRIFPRPRSWCVRLPRRCGDNRGITRLVTVRWAGLVIGRVVESAGGGDRTSCSLTWRPIARGGVCDAQP